MAKRFLIKNLKQTAVYWANPVKDGFGGWASIDDPVEVSVRWEDRTELFLSATGKELQSQSIVYVAQDMEEGEWLYLGTLADLSSADEGSPWEVEGALEVRAFKKSPTIRADDYMRKVWL